MHGETRQTSSLFSITALVVSMTLVAVGNGLMLAYVPYVLSRADAPSWTPGAAVSAIAFGETTSPFGAR